MTEQQRSAMQQALDALQRGDVIGNSIAVQHLSAALAQQAEPTDEQIRKTEECFSNEFGLEAKYSLEFARAVLALRPVAQQAEPVHAAPVVEPTDEQIMEAAEPFGEFMYGDAQGGKRIAFARAVLALRPVAESEPVAWRPVSRYISDVLGSDAAPSEKHIARTIMHLLPLDAALNAPQPAPVAQPTDMHSSDCATHNAPAYPPGPCDCLPTQAMCRAAVVCVNGADVYDKLPPTVLEIEEGIYGEVWRAMQAKAPNQQPAREPLTPPAVCFRSERN